MVHQSKFHKSKVKPVRCEFHFAMQKKGSATPPKFNIAPEKWWLEDEFPFGIAYF